ncbi:MAG: LysR family transcriptional regulator [Clostridia bacterium]|nr:LysR family transcriptional regulator [Clostridia bacterium]
MNLTWLHYFYTIAQYEHVTRAAEEIHISQPALTKTLKLLEAELEVPLFMKNGRNIILTEYGRYLKGELDKIIPVIDAIPEQMNKLKQKAGMTVRLNVIAASTAVMSAVVEYKKLHPDVIFSLIQNEEKPDCDLSITTNYSHPTPAGNLRKRCVMEEKIFLAVPRNSAYAACESIDLATVSDEGFITLAGSRPFRTICDKFCTYAGFSPRIVFESDSPAAVRDIIGAEAGIGFWPEYSWGRISSSDIVLLPISNPTCQREIIIELHRQPSPSPWAEDYFEFLVGWLHQSWQHSGQHGDMKSR